MAWDVELEPLVFGFSLRSFYVSFGMVRFTYLWKHLGTIPPSILLTNIAALEWDWQIKRHLRQTTICQLRRSAQVVPATHFGDRRRPLIPSTANENRSHKPTLWPTPLQRSKDFYKLEDHKPVPWHTPLRRGEEFLNLEGEVQGATIPEADPAALSMDQSSISEDYKPAPWHKTIAMGWIIHQFGGQSSRNHDTSGRPCRFIHGSAPHHSYPLYEWI